MLASLSGNFNVATVMRGLMNDDDALTAVSGKGSQKN